MISLKWILPVLSIPFLWIRRSTLIQPDWVDWNPSLSPQTVRIEGHRIFYIVKGEGNPLILIHGFGAGLWVWEHQVDILSRFYRVFALDLIGHGYSDRPKIDYTAETYIHFLKGFMDILGIEKATLIGNSMGGGIAWAMAISFPERVERLVLIDSVPPDVLKQGRNDSFKTLVALKRIPFLPYLIIAGRSKRSIRWVLEECLYEIERLTPDIVARQYRLLNIRGTTHVLSSTLHHAEEAMRLKDSLSLIEHPTLVLWGEKDQIFPPSVGESLHQAIPGSIFHIIRGSGHIPMWETPEEVNQAVLSFLENSSESKSRDKNL